jgi:uncharacterized caspase-like protein
MFGDPPLVTVATAIRQWQTLAIHGGAMRLPALILALVISAASATHAEKRVALVIGNATYKNAATLQNPKNDATDVSEALKRLGFETIIGLDLDKAGMDEKMINFSRAARDADVALVYYSGHAMQFAGANYLMPIDAALRDEADLRRLIRVDEIVADLSKAKNLRVLALDACRVNPLAEELSRSMEATRGPAVDRGLARIIPPSGMIISYATQAGRTAADGRGRNSPYTLAFLKNIETKEEIGTVFRHISADVYAATASNQLPELYLSLIGDFYLRGRPEPQISEPPGPSEAERAWAVTQNTTSIAVLEDFIRQFGTTPYGSLARARLDEMKNQAREAGARATEAAEAKAAEAARIKAEQEAKAAEARAAEAARIKAEQEAKAAEARAAENARIKAEQEAKAAEAKAAEAARIKAEQEAKAAEAKAAEAARIKAEQEAKAAEAKTAEAARRPQNLAALTPSDQSTISAALSPGEIVRQLQIELRRVGCFTSDIDGEWNPNSGHALELFNEHSGMNLDTKAASLDALDAVRGKSSRVCPLICQPGFHADSERCVETICKAGFTVGDSGTCVRVPERPNRTARPEPKQASPGRDKPTNETSKGASGGGVMLCDRMGCRQGPAGCKPVYDGPRQSNVCE